MNTPNQVNTKSTHKSTTKSIWSWSVRKGVLALILILGIIPIINAQSSGSRGGVNAYPYGQSQHPSGMNHIVDQRIEDYIQVDSKVELRVKPDQIRIVLAVSDNAKTSAECEEKVFSRIKQLKEALTEIGVKPDDVVDDFIAVLPRYKYVVENLEGEKVAVETLMDYGMQSNLHIKVPNDELALKAIRAAFKIDITDIIAFDYWSTELDAVKQQALKQAIEKANSKAQLILGQTFDEMPTPINVKASTQLIMPDSLYQSFNNSFSQTLKQNYRGNLPVITAFRPKNTYYKGHVDPSSDQQPDTVSMHCEISVVSTVQLFFASPVNKRLPANRGQSLAKSSRPDKISYRSSK